VGLTVAQKEVFFEELRANHTAKVFLPRSTSKFFAG
jgi:hypothetical protein